MKKKTKKILALILALALITGVCVFANGVVGNPVSKWLATNTVNWNTGQYSAFGTQDPQSHAPSLPSGWLNRTEATCSSQPSCHR